MTKQGFKVEEGMLCQVENGRGRVQAFGKGWLEVKLFSSGKKKRLSPEKVVKYFVPLRHVGGDLSASRRERNDLEWGVVDQFLIGQCAQSPGDRGVAHAKRDEQNEEGRSGSDSMRRQDYKIPAAPG